MIILKSINEMKYEIENHKNNMIIKINDYFKIN